MASPIVTKRRTALVLQGGGARGAYHVGVLRAIAEITGAQRSPFQIVCGASVGAINAASVAAASLEFQAGVRHLEDLWRGLHSDRIYDTRALSLLLTSARWAGTLVFGHLGMRATGGLLDYSPLAAMLKQEFNRKQLLFAIRTGALHALCITASSYSEGMAITFFEGNAEIEGWTRARRRGERTAITTDHLLASSALPFAFAPVRLKANYFGDGALRSTSPLSPAIHTGAERILVIATRDSTPDPARRDPPLDSPSIGVVAGHALDILFNDNLEADHERMMRINHTISLVPPEARAQTTLRQVDTLMLQPSMDMRELAKQFRDEVPRPVRVLMRSIGAWRGDGRMISYLMFEPGYIGAQIDLGYADTMARAPEITAFLQD